MSRSRLKTIGRCRLKAAAHGSAYPSGYETIIGGDHEVSRFCEDGRPERRVEGDDAVERMFGPKLTRPSEKVRCCPTLKGLHPAAKLHGCVRRHERHVSITS